MREGLQEYLEICMAEDGFVGRYEVVGPRRGKKTERNLRNGLSTFWHQCAAAKMGTDACPSSMESSRSMASKGFVSPMDPSCRMSRRETPWLRVS